MPLNPLAPVTDYQSMLNRIFWFTTASGLAAVGMLRLYLPAADVWFARVDSAVQFGGAKFLPLPAGYLLPALAIGIAAHVFRLHARISDSLGIRESFDLEFIVREFAHRLAIDLERVDPTQLREDRPRLMRKTFYPFVSGLQPQIDPQLVQQALDAWSWFWIGVESTFVFTLAGFALVAGRAYQVGFQTLGGALVLAFAGLPLIRSQCRRYANAQVREILSDPARAAAVRKAFDELTADAPTPRRLAA